MSSTRTSKNILIHRLKNGDEKAFTEIYNIYWSKLLAIGYHFTKDKHMAEDIVHDVLLSLWQRKNELAIESLDAYLATAVKFAVFKMLAKSKRRDEILDTIPSENSINNIEQQLDAKFLEDYTNGIVEQMPEKTRLVFELSRHHGASNKEITQKVNLSGKSVEYHLTKALKLLREKIQQIKLFFV
jgi:RNA polymerase sigma-70 factor (ECF subfamily)